MSSDANKKHRHDVGHPDHGAASSEPVTRALQFVLGGAVTGSLALVLYTLAVLLG